MVIFHSYVNVYQAGYTFTFCSSKVLEIPPKKAYGGFDGKIHGTHVGFSS